MGSEVPAKTLPEFIAWARVNPGKAQFGSSGAGSAMHFIGVQLAAQAKFELQHIPYRDGAPALTDVLGGTIPAVLTTPPNLVQPHKTGKVRILAHSAAQRLPGLPGLPDMPTFSESGFPALTLSEIFLFVVPARAPVAVQKDQGGFDGAGQPMRLVDGQIAAPQAALLADRLPLLAVRRLPRAAARGAIVRPDSRSSALRSAGSCR